MQDQKYIRYSDPDDIKRLDLNTWNVTPMDIEQGITGRHLYFAEPRRANIDPNSYWRDPVTQYMVKMDAIGSANLHPDTPSRFGYDNGCPNGYCFGVMPGRYNDNPYCNYEEQPNDVAPCRLYDPVYLNGNISMSENFAPGDRFRYSHFDYDIKYTKW